MKTLTKTVFAFVALMLGTAFVSTQAAILADFTFSGDVAVRLESKDSDTNTTVGDLVLGDGITSNVWETRGFWVGSSSGPPAIRFDASEDANDGTVLDDDYFAFTVTPNAGLQIDFTSLTFENRNGGATVSIASSQDSFGSVIGSATATSAPNWSTDTISLAPMSIETGSTEIRLYFSGGTNTNFVIDDINLNGTVSPIPEPSTFALLGLAGLAALFFRRRHA